MLIAELEAARLAAVWRRRRPRLKSRVAVARGFGRAGAAGSPIAAVAVVVVVAARFVVVSRYQGGG